MKKGPGELVLKVISQSLSVNLIVVSLLLYYSPISARLYTQKRGVSLRVNNFISDNFSNCYREL